MSVHNLNVPQIGLKLDLLLRTGKQGIKTASALSKRLNIAPDHLSRIKNGTRSIPDEVFLELTNIYQIEQKIWFENLEVFGQSLGLSSQEVSKIIGIRIPGIDFSSRITDKRMIKDIHRTY
ncbi:MAG: hypothetical protein SCALA702_01980 [Melioribacteraceae bacterium]|nr:MAG: hypothetical protein SCALA702_01980 [Melioribacteraceae bacterium]